VENAGQGGSVSKELKDLGKVVGKFLVGVSAVALNAYVVTVLWAWFVVAVFGLPALSIAAVLGLHLLYKMFTFNQRVEINLVEDGVSADIASIVLSLLALGVGYGIHLCM
jgi:uncharacterized membrane protein SpoIIM required for sporulation